MATYTLMSRIDDGEEVPLDEDTPRAVYRWFEEQLGVVETPVAIPMDTGQTRYIRVVMVKSDAEVLEDDLRELAEAHSLTYQQMIRSVSLLLFGTVVDRTSDLTEDQYEQVRTFLDA